jgi:hypothetical protein
MFALRRRTDPWWDLDGAGVRRERLRRRIVGGLAFVLAVASCGLTAAAWIREFGPLIAARLG